MVTITQTVPMKIRIILLMAKLVVVVQVPGGRIKHCAEV